jgi:hypothetical protein
LPRRNHRYEIEEKKIIKKKTKNCLMKLLLIKNKRFTGSNFMWQFEIGEKKRIKVLTSRTHPRNRKRRRES